MGEFSGVLHVHSTFSDGTMSLSQIRDWAIAEQLDFVVVTDHSEGMPPDRRSRLFDECERQSGRVLLVPSVEFAHSGRHVIVMGPRECIVELNDEEAVTMPEKVRERGGMTIWAHPALTYAFSLRDGAAASYDGWETWNLKVDGDLPNLPVVSLLERVARERPTLSLAGLDLHGELARYVGPRLLVSAEPDALTSGVLIEALCRGEHRIMSDPLLLPTELSTSRRIRSWLRHRRTRGACIARYIAHRVKTCQSSN